MQTQPYLDDTAGCVVTTSGVSCHITKNEKVMKNDTKKVMSCDNLVNIFPHFLLIITGRK